MLSLARCALQARTVMRAPPPSQRIAASTWIALNTSYQPVFARKRTRTASPAIGAMIPSHSKNVLVFSSPG